MDKKGRRRFLRLASSLAAFASSLVVTTRSYALDPCQDAAQPACGGTEGEGCYYDNGSCTHWTTGGPVTHEIVEVYGGLGTPNECCPGTPSGSPDCRFHQLSGAC